MHTESIKDWRIIIILVIAIAAMAILLALGFYFYNFNGSLSTTKSDWGTFGDYIGGTLNPFFGFLSLMAILVTIVLQSSEMKLTRKEMELTRQEMERSVSAQEKSEVALNLQAQTQLKQQFEGTFFAVLNEHNKALQELSTLDPEGGIRLTRISNLYGSVFYMCHNLLESKNALIQNNHLCGTYFRTLYQILKFIATKCPDGSIGEDFFAQDIVNSPLAPSEKMYSNMVRAIVPDKALQLLAINCACDSPTDAFWKFRLVLERYAFLEHMPFVIDIAANPSLKSLIAIYDCSAFGSSIYLTD